MTTPEERRLAELLQGEAELLEPGGSALDAIRSGVRRRRARRRTALSASALGLAVVVGATVALTGGGTTSSLEPAPQASGGPSSSPSPSAGPSADPDGATTSGGGTPFFPFTSDEQAADWAAAPGDRQWAEDPYQVAQHLVDDLLELKGVTAAREMVKGRVELRAGDAVVGSVHLELLGTGDQRPWVAVRVLSSRSDDPMPTAQPAEPLTVTGPAEAASVKSPLQVTGRVVGVDESVNVRLRTSAGELLDEDFAMAGSEQPWSAQLSWSSTSWSLGVVTAVTRSAKDSSVARVVAVPVLRDASPTREVPGPTEAFVGEVDGVVGLYDATDGKRLLQVSYPPAGYTDVAPRRAGTKVVWLRLGRECSDRKVIQRDLATDVTTTLVADQPLEPVLGVSPSGRWTAWVTVPGCERGPRTVVVQGPDGIREIAVGDDAPVGTVDIADDGAVLVQVVIGDAASLELFPPGSTTGRGFDVRPNCPITLGAFAGDDRVIGLETCFTDPSTPQPPSVLLLSLSGERLSSTPTQLGSLARLATSGDQVLVQLFEPSGAIGRLVGGRFEPFLEQPACRETLEAKGCLTSVDW